MKIIDISKGIFSTPVYPGDPEPELIKLSKISNGDEYNLSILKACVHTGTHIDSPKHYFDSGLSVDELPLEMFVGKCIVISAEKLKEIRATKDTKILLLKGKLELNKVLVEIFLAAGYVTIGTEMDTIGDSEVHRLLLEKNKGILENLELSHVDEGEYFIYAPPLKIEGSEGSFVRAILIK